MGACRRRDFDVSIPIITYLLEEGASAAYQAPPNSLLDEGFLCSRLGLSRDTPIKNAASQPELLRLLIDAGATLDAHIVVYAVEDWCDEIAKHLGEVLVRDLQMWARENVGKVADILSCEGGGDEDGETKGDEAATNEGANPFATSLFTSQIAAALQEVLDLGGGVNAPDTTGTCRDYMHSLEVC